MPQIKSLNELAEKINGMPGIGPKTANKLAVYLAVVKPQLAKQLSESIVAALDSISQCPVCGNVSESKYECYICNDETRKPQIMIVESVTDLLQIEAAGSFQGRYQVLYGLVSPARGVAFEDLNIDNLVDRVVADGVGECIIALPASVEGDTTTLLLQELLGDEVKMSRLARGLPTGSNIEFLDAPTLNNSFAHRTKLS